MRNWLRAVFLVVLALAALGHVPAAKTRHEPGNVCNRVTNSEVAKGMNILNGMHLLPGSVGETTEVNERVWAKLTRKSKIKAALIVYCMIGPDKTTLILSGWRDGETKASVINGNYSD